MQRITTRLANITAQASMLPFQTGNLPGINSLLGFFWGPSEARCRLSSNQKPKPRLPGELFQSFMFVWNPKNALSVSNFSVEMETPQGSEEMDTEFVSTLISSQVNCFNVYIKENFTWIIRVCLGSRWRWTERSAWYYSARWQSWGLNPGPVGSEEICKWGSKLHCQIYCQEIVYQKWTHI